MVERVLGPVLFEPRPWMTCRITEATVRGGEPEYDLFGLPSAAPLRHRVARRSASG